MDYLTTRSKYISETISIVMDFSSVLPTGSSIQGVPTVIVSLFTGYDPSPQDILYQLATVSQGVLVEQRIRLGLPGVIYSICFQVISTDGETFEQTTYLAILPNEGNVTPVFNPVYLTSSIYPIQSFDTLAVDTTWQSGGLGAYYFIPPDSLWPTLTWVSGQLVGTSLPYHIPGEGISVSSTWISGEFVGTAVYYYIPADSITVDAAWISGEFVGDALTYNIPADWLSVGVVWESGSLT